MVFMNAGKYAAKKIAVLAILTALSLITFIIESLFPPLIIPGAKMGLANVFSFAALIMYSPLEAFAVVALRTVFGAIYAGNFSAVLYSFTGGVISMAVSSLLMYVAYPRVSALAISVAAAVAHNITQNVVFVFLSGSALMFGYMPYLILLGVLSGAIVGGVIMLIFRGVPLGTFAKVIKDRTKKQVESTTGQVKDKPPSAT